MFCVCIYHLNHLLRIKSSGSGQSSVMGKEKRCKKGEHVIGAEIGLHDDYGLSNFEYQWKYWTKLCIGFTSKVCVYYWIWFYLASIVNIRLYCSDKDKDGTTMLEGDLWHNFHHKNDLYKDMINDIQRKER